MKGDVVFSFFFFFSGREGLFDSEVRRDYASSANAIRTLRSAVELTCPSSYAAFQYFYGGRFQVVVLRRWSRRRVIPAADQPNLLYRIERITQATCAGRLAEARQMICGVFF